MPRLRVRGLRQDNIWTLARGIRMRHHDRVNLSDGGKGSMDEESRRGFEYEYLIAKLTEISEALALLDGGDDPLGHHDARQLLLDAQGRLIAALASYDTSPASLN